MRLVGQLWRARSGAAAIESAFVLPATIVLLLGTVELGRAIWTQSALTFAVQEAARCAAVQPGVCGTDAQIRAFAASKVTALAIPASAFASAKLACGWQVSGSVQYRFLAYAAFPSAPVIGARVCQP